MDVSQQDLHDLELSSGGLLNLIVSVSYHCTSQLQLQVKRLLMLLFCSRKCVARKWSEALKVFGSTTDCSQRRECRYGGSLLQVAWVYTVSTATLMGLLVGVTQRILGSPGDLPEVVHQIHTNGRISITQAPSMFVCSAFSIAAGEWL